MKKLSIIMKNAHILAKTFEGDYAACLSLGLKQAYKDFKKATTSLKAADISKLDKNFYAKSGSIKSMFKGVYLQVSETRYTRVDSQQELNAVLGVFQAFFGDGLLIQHLENRYRFVSNEFSKWCEKGNPTITSFMEDFQ